MNVHSPAGPGTIGETVNKRNLVTKGNRLGAGTSASEMLPAEYWTTPAQGKVLPVDVVYVTGGTLVPRMPADMDIPSAITVAMRNGKYTKLPNGLRPRSDAMARLMARGAQGTSAYRACYKATGKPIQDSRRAWAIAGSERFTRAVAEYREELERRQRQASIGMRDFVLGRLTVEAQTAPEAAARIKALDLLGKSEGMWTTVHRTEKAMSPKDITSLRDQLEQRLRSTLSRLSPSMAAALSHDTGSGRPSSGADETAEPHPGDSPLISRGFPSKTVDTIPLTQSDQNTTPISPQESHQNVPGGPILDNIMPGASEPNATIEPPSSTKGPLFNNVQGVSLRKNRATRVRKNREMVEGDL